MIEYMEKKLKNIINQVKAPTMFASATATPSEPDKPVMRALPAHGRTIAITALPEWFLEWGLFSVLRNDKSLSAMQLLDYPCKFNEHQGGRLRLSVDTEGMVDIFVDMFSEHPSADGSDLYERAFKSVRLSNIYAHNPDLFKEPIPNLDLPETMDTDMATQWRTTVVASIGRAKKNVEVIDG